MPSFVMTWPRRRGVRLSPLLFALPCVNVAGGGSGDRVVDVAGIDGAGGGCRRRVVRRRGGGAGGLSTCCRRGGYRQGERRVVRRRGERRVVCRPAVDVGGIDRASGGWFVDVASGGWSVDLLSTWGASSTRRAVMRAVMVVGVDGAGGGWL